MSNKNFKVSCVGIDMEGLVGRVTFFEYGVKNAKEAVENITKDSINRGLMLRHAVDWKRTNYRAVPCTVEGEITEANLEKELVILLEEEAEMDELRASMRITKIDRSEG